MDKQKEKKNLQVKLHYNNKIVEQIRFRWRRDTVEVFGKNGWFLGLSILKSPYLEELALLNAWKET